MSTMDVMIVEDEAIIALDLKEILKKSGYRISAIVGSGNAAIKKAKELKPDLILMDVMLGRGINGIQAAGEIRKYLNIPVIFISSFSDNHAVANAYEVSPYGYIVKPFDENELVKKIKDIRTDRFS